MTSTRLPGALLSALILAAAPPAIATEAPPELALLRGGALRADPVAHGRYAYIPTGRVLSTWDHGDRGAPLNTATTAPVDGVINGLLRRGDHLYASWRADAGGGGLAVYSLADPAAPELVADIQDYTDEDRREVTGVAATDTHLYLLDQRNGIFVSDLADPAEPELLPTPVDGLPVHYTRIATFGDTIHAAGRTLLGATVLHLYDAGAPHEPFRFANHQVSGIDYQNLTLEGDGVLGVGARLTLFDLGEPLQMTPRGDLSIPPAFSAARFGDHVYTFGAGPGLDVWDVSDIDAPAAAGQLDVLALGTRRWLATDDLLLLPTELNLLHAIDASTPGAPTLAATVQLPGGAASVDIAAHGDALVLSQREHGLSVNDPATLAALARFDADLPEQLPARSFQQLAVRDGIAYLTSWGAGLFNVDLSDPDAPVQIGHVEFPFAATIDLGEHHAYLTRSTNGAMLGVVDIADPAAPALVHQQLLPSQAYRTRVDGQHAYIAEGRVSNDAANTGGLRIFSLADPAAPVQVARLDDGCGAAFDLAIDSDVSLLYLACTGGLQVIDIVDPAQPSLVAAYDAGASYGYTRVEQHHDRAWFANVDGLHALDVSDPTAPALLSVESLGGQAAERVSLIDGRLYVLGGNTGVHVFALDDDGGEGDAVPLENGVAVAGLDGGEGDELLFSIDVPEGAAALTVLSYGGRGDVDLLVRHGQPPTAEAYDARSTRPGNNESVRIAAPAAGTWYVALRGRQAFTGVSLQARH